MDGRRRRWVWPAAAAIALAATSLTGLRAAAAPTVQVGQVHVDVFSGGSGSGPSAFPVGGSPGTYRFSAGPFTNLTFNPPNSPPGSHGNSGICSSGGTTTYEALRPMVQVDPSSCIATPLQNGSGTEQAGVQTGAADLRAFQAEINSSFTVSGAGDVTFTSFSDDGSVLGVGPSGMNQPSSTTESCTGTTAKYAYPILHCGNNGSHYPDPFSFTLRFPAAGTYPVEVDYAEEGTLDLAFTLLANGAPMAPSPVSPPEVTATVSGVAVDVFTNPSSRADFPWAGGGAQAAPDGAPVFSAGPFGGLTFDPPNTPPDANGQSNSDICSNGQTKAWDFDRPMNYVDPTTCTPTAVKNGSGTEGAGSKGTHDLTAFEAEYTTTITVDQAGTLPVEAFPDDGILVGIGADKNGMQPTSNESCNGTTAKLKLAILDCAFNNSHFAAEDDFVVRFPEAGTYPLEVDHAENGNQALSMTIEFNHRATAQAPVTVMPDGTAAGLGLAGGAAVGGAVVLTARRRRRRRHGDGDSD